MNETPQKKRDPALLWDQPLSSALRERLKRSRQPFASPRNVTQPPETLTHTHTPPRSVTQPPESPGGADGSRIERRGEHAQSSESPRISHRDLLQLRENLKKDLKEKSETLRRLKMVKMYRTKNDLMELQALIQKWRRCAQAALYELQSELCTGAPGSSLSQIIEHFGLDPQVLQFNSVENEFTQN